MSTEKTGRHARPKKKGVSTALATAVVLGAGMAIPVLTAGSASAATVAQWDQIAQCESGGRWNLSYGDRDSTGGLQFRIASWQTALSYLRSKGIDTSSYPAMPYQATKQQQIIAGEALLALQGPGAWTCNGISGPRVIGSKYDSMFLGGPNPYPSNTTPSSPSPGKVVSGKASWFGGPDEPQPLAGGGSTPPIMKGVALWDVPFGTQVTITSKQTGKSVTAPVVDRGPGKGPIANGVVIDLLPETWDALGVSRDQGLQEITYTLGSKTPAPKPTTPPKPSTPPSTPATGEKYVVKKGDTLYGIATEKKVEGGWQALYAANKTVVGSDPDLIFPGQKLTIPQPVIRYTVKSGDTLSKIAATLKVKGGWQTLYEKNKSVIGDNPNLIKPGMVLIVSGTATPATPTKPSTPKPPTPKPSTPSTQGYVAPLAKGSYYKGDGLINSGGCVSRSCGGHSGVDLTARQGTAVRSVAAGTVIHAGYGYAGAAYGNHVVIKHADGRYTLYAHLSASVVRAGATVSAGQMIGNVGSTGNSSGPHLHFEVRTDPKNFSAGIFLNPVTYLAAHGVIL